MPNEGLTDGDVTPDTNPPPPPAQPAPAGALQPGVQGDDAAAAIAARLASLEEKLQQAVSALARLERLRQIEQALRAAGAADVALAMPAVERSIEASPQQGVDEAVAQLRQSRPGLFLASRSSAGATGAPNPTADSRAGELASLALRAASGDPKAVRDYLRARRGE